MSWPSALEQSSPYGGARINYQLKTVGDKGESAGLDLFSANIPFPPRRSSPSENYWLQTGTCCSNREPELGWGLRGSVTHPQRGRPAATPLAGGSVTLALKLWPRAQVMLQPDRPRRQTNVESSNSHPLSPPPTPKPRTSQTA